MGFNSGFKGLIVIVAGDSRARSPHSGGPHGVGDPFLLIARIWNDRSCLVPLQSICNMMHRTLIEIIPPNT